MQFGVIDDKFLLRFTIK